MGSVIKNVNRVHKNTLSRQEKLAIWLTDHAGTMYFFYLCCVLALIPLVWVQSLPVIQFISSGFLQLVFLPLILLTQNLQNRHAELRAEEDYKVNIKAEFEVEQLNKMLFALVMSQKGGSNAPKKRKEKRRI